MLGDALALIEFIKKNIANWDVKVAHFDGGGQKIYGDQDVNINIHQGSDATKFFFEVQPIEGYTFLRYPVNPSGVLEDFALLTDGTFSSTHFRYIREGRLSAKGHPNVRVPFIIYGYKTKALTEAGSPVGP